MPVLIDFHRIMPKKTCQLIRRIVPVGSSNNAGCIHAICGQTSKNTFEIKTELVFSNVVGFRGGWVLCLNLKCNCTLKLLDPELLNSKP